jgi:hypothetical protein
VNLPREDDVAAGRDRCVIEDGRERPSRLLRRCCETSKKARDPEADAAFVAGCRLWHKRQYEGEQDRIERPLRE